MTPGSDPRYSGYDNFTPGADGYTADAMSNETGNTPASYDHTPGMKSPRLLSSAAATGSPKMQLGGGGLSPRMQAQLQKRSRSRSPARQNKNVFGEEDDEI